MLRGGGKGLVDGERVLEHASSVSSDPTSSSSSSAVGPLARGGAQAIDAQPPGQLGEPGPDRGVVAEPVEMLVRAREHFLEDVLRVGVRTTGTPGPRWRRRNGRTGRRARPTPAGRRHGSARRAQLSAQCLRHAADSDWWLLPVTQRRRCPASLAELLRPPLGFAAGRSCPAAVRSHVESVALARREGRPRVSAPPASRCSSRCSLTSSSASICASRRLRAASRSSSSLARPARTFSRSSSPSPALVAAARAIACSALLRAASRADSSSSRCFRRRSRKPVHFGLARFLGALAARWLPSR